MKIPTIDELIAAAPDMDCDREQQYIGDHGTEKPKGVAIQNFIDFPVLQSSRTELWGDEWQREYEKALETINNGGIVVLIGDRGTGKTQMAWELAKNCRLPGIVTKDTSTGFSPTYIVAPALYRTAEELFDEMKACFSPKAEMSSKQQRAIYDNSALLVIDEIQVRGESKFEDDKITSIIDRKYRSKKPAIIIGNIKLDQIEEQLSASVVNRLLERGIIVECNWQSYRK